MTGAIVAVTVTYGSRWALLRRALQSARSEGCARAIVVSNGAIDPIAVQADAEFGSFVDVVVLARNEGSAGGFKAGLERALALDATLILLLDDDNELQPGALQRMRDAYVRWRVDHAPDALAMQAYRERLFDLAAGTPSRGMYGDNPHAFFGFHALDIPAKIIRRFPFTRRLVIPRRVRPESSIANGPYSGMLFHADVVRRHGFPDDRFVLYVDDTDFSARITRAGGRIVLVADAALKDLEESFNDIARFTNSFDGRLIGDDDFRAYYWTRNNAYYERHRLAGRGVVRRLNRWLFMALLWLRAARCDRLARFRLVCDAIRDGESSRLGQHPAYPLR